MPSVFHKPDMSNWIMRNQIFCRVCAVVQCCFELDFLKFISGFTLFSTFYMF